MLNHYYVFGKFYFALVSSRFYEIGNRILYQDGEKIKYSSKHCIKWQQHKQLTA